MVAMMNTVIYGIEFQIINTGADHCFVDLLGC